tara:strand:+ start:2695 stop:3963 length:1269 start_codon:yes stop_codon:yes gene_type:complete
MAKTKEKPIVDNEVGKLKVKEKPVAKENTTEKAPKNNEPKGDVESIKEKMKMKPVDLSKETVWKVNLDEQSKPKKDETPEEVKGDVVDEGGVVELIEDTSTPQEQEEVQPEAKTQEVPVVEEVTNEEKVEKVAEVVEEAIVEAEETGTPLPENVQKLVNFIDETGGNIQDYVRLNQDYSEMDNQTLLNEYYKQTKPHLTNEEIEFIMDDSFSYNEELEEEKDIKRKKLAMKEQVAEAKLHLESVKSKYYEDIKAGSKLTEEQQEAVSFFNKYNEESESNKKLSNIFQQRSENVFNDKFKGFEYNVGEKRFRFNVKDVDKVKTTQRDINNFIGKFLGKDNTMSDAEGYHKGLFTAMNPDRIANHFYEQGKADALKASIAESKNINMDPRQAHVDNVNNSGFTARALNDDGPDFKFRIKNKNNN